MATAKARPVEPEADELTALTYAIFGFPGDNETGLMHRFIRLEQKVDDLRQAALAAAVSFGFGSLGVALAIVLS